MEGVIMLAKISKAMVMEGFNKPLVLKDFKVPKREKGQVLIKMEAAGVCGSDVHMWNGNDPRTPLPIILGHEGIGRIDEIDDGACDIFGTKLNPGDLVMWDRGVTCGKCYYCTIKEEPSLCPNRKTYGINMSCSKLPYLNGNYGQYLMLMPGTKIMKIDKDIDPAVLVSAGCAGATSAHTNELHGIKPGDTVIVQGPGPVGLFSLAFSIASGASKTLVTGMKEDKVRLNLAKEFGAHETMVVDEMNFDERIQFTNDLTKGLGADHVIDTTGSAHALKEGIKMVGKCGTYSLPGIAVPVGEIPISFYEDVALKNVRIQGVWVSDTRHTYEAIQLVLTGRFPFEKLITHRYSLEDANKALEVMEKKEAIKAVLVP